MGNQSKEKQYVEVKILHRENLNDRYFTYCVENGEEILQGSLVKANCEEREGMELYIVKVENNFNTRFHSKTSLPMFGSRQRKILTDICIIQENFELPESVSNLIA